MAERFFEGLGYSLLNEFIGIFRRKEGFAKTSRYEVVVYQIYSQTVQVK